MKINKRSDNDEDGLANKKICMMWQSTLQLNHSGKNENSLNISFLWDLGACDQVVENSSVLFKSQPEDIKSASKKESADLEITGSRELYLKSNYGAWKPFMLTGVKCSPDIVENVLSTSWFADAAYRTVFGWYRWYNQRNIICRDL